MPGLDDTRFLKVEECASLARVSPVTIYRLIHDGAIDAVKVGRNFRIYESSYHRYLNTPVTATGNHHR
jgi:excisionase family DNA binding protein